MGRTDAVRGRRSIHDVAAEAGVSVATVSRVLSGARSVREDSAAAVLAAVEKLGYRPNQVGRALRRQQTQVVGMVVPRVNNPFFPSIVQACEEDLRARGYALLLSTSDDDPDVERQRLEMLVDRQVDGLLVSPCRWADSGPAVAAAQRLVPLVELDRGTDGFGGDFVAVDDDGGIGQVVDHLRASGRARLAFVGSDEDNFSGKARHEAFVRRAGRLPRGHVLLGTFSEAWGYEAGLRVLRGAPRPDAVVCANDLIAIGVLRAAEELGLSVPGDVAVSGYDDIDMARVCKPSLTTVRQPVAELTRTAIDLLLARMADRGRPATRRLLGTALVVRESTAG
ncbi:LacI family DNA-binding transcriptional regulator [Kineosporia sp. A_224]|uniref:LacI family DNA-binding transcriptional regulator n=1 Tax=Kineosporia sp. A_224 TaxID=1962180 RepID=UPI000B4AB890|nr:LacI family DNA-binding transcriptional regulator [Kineosporia sp. A_224]